LNHATPGALWRARILRGSLTAVLATGLALGVSPIAPTATADAAPAPASAAAPAAKKDAHAPKRHEGRPVQQMNAKPLPTRGEKVMRVVRAQAGDPYAWGGAGPNRFDCSGLTMYVYQRAAGERLPHSSSAQVGRTKRISRAAARPGDLVFFHDGGGVYHVAIYAGHNKVWHAPGSGQRVTRASIWTGSVFFGRVR
jgi:cell wall-associated NlpC family hydrolase